MYLYFTVAKVVESLAPHRYGFESRQGLWILLFEEDIQLVYGTSAVLLRCPHLSEIMYLSTPVLFEN